MKNKFKQFFGSKNVYVFDYNSACGLNFFDSSEHVLARQKNRRKTSSKNSDGKGAKNTFKHFFGRLDFGGLDFFSVDRTSVDWAVTVYLFQK